jgi:uncharacterized protein (UPF0335 family)
MSDAIGKNTPSAALLRSFIERLERLDEQKKALGDDRKAVMAEAKSSGYDAPAITRLLKRRKAKPHDVAEADTLDDLYRHSIGMDAEPPLFRQLAAISKQTVAGEKLLEAFKLLVPPNEEVIITVGGKKIRIWRDKDGEPQSEDYVPPEAKQQAHSKSTLPPARVRKCRTALPMKRKRSAMMLRRPIIPLSTILFRMTTCAAPMGFGLAEGNRE